MSPDETGRVLLGDLAERIRADVAAARDQARASAALMTTLEQTGALPDAPAMAFLSVAADHGYTALESAFLRIARGIDGVLPGGEDWQLALLHQMTLPMQDRRIAVLSSETAARLDPFRRHRHWLRHAYTGSFAWPAIEETARGLPEVVALASGDLEKFVEFLEVSG
jgi:hypothetical protein